MQIAKSGLVSSLNREFEEKRAEEAAHGRGMSFLALMGFAWHAQLGLVVSETEMERTRLLPVLARGKHLILGTDVPDAPEQPELRDRLRGRGYFVEVGIASRSSIEEGLAFFRSAAPEHHAVRIGSSVDEGKLGEFTAEIASLQSLREKFSDAPSAEALTLTLAGALRLGASDVHFEPEERSIALRFRVDGVLQHIIDLPRESFTRVLEQIKYQGHLQLNVHTRPQDGHFTFVLRAKSPESRVQSPESPLAGVHEVVGNAPVENLIPPPLGRGLVVGSSAGLSGSLGDRASPEDPLPSPPPKGEGVAPATEIDIRVSVIPGEWGEGVVLRILDPRGTFISIERIGFGEHEALVRQAIAKTHGLILITGPTGSGKTTTLYAILRERAVGETKVISLEDPVEYHVAGVEQVTVDPRDPDAFSHELRAVLRHDPDVIMIGEIRDRETAQISLNAALTGHLVFSTLHTNDALSSIFRLLHMGVEPFLIAPGLELVVAQRLPRRICPSCATLRPITEDERSRLTALGAEDIPADTPEPHGCPACSGTGYHGRLGIFSFLPISDAMRREILESPTSERLEPLARAAGMQPLVQDGLMKVRAGLTTVSELLRVAG